MINKEELIKKYNVSVPRYTSYPPANYFHEFSNREYLRAIEQSNQALNNNISFYLHMPFCRRLCHYCGCNSYQLHKNGETERYIAAVHKEIDLVAQHLDKSRRISQIHYGGGSPTAMKPAVLKELNDHMLSLFPTIEQPEIAIECHPGYLSHDDWKELVGCGFNRFSIGVQDLDPQVLKAVNRQPSALPLEEIFSILREAGASINLDFLFGLPYQSAESFKRNIERAVSLRPDRMTTFSYGHVPWVFERQKILEQIGLPQPEEKSRMFQNAKAVLAEAGYKPIGLDHFVLPQDELYQALTSKQLHRNFQGYCTRRTTAQVYAFGVTGISQLDAAYAQNTKSINDYIDSLDNGQLTIRKGYELTPQERLTREVIEMLMCNYHIDWNELAATTGKTVAELQAAVHYDTRQLDDMQLDGIISFDATHLTMTTEGSPFVRNVAAALDPLMLNTTRKFSKPI